MDSSFVNYDGRSVHDMIENLLALSGDPEAIRRLQESINAVDQRAQSSIAVVNAAIDQLDEYNDTQDTEIAALTTTGGVKNIVPNDGPDTFEQTGITFTKNADGSVTANGTATDTVIYRIKQNFTLPRGKYVISGSPSGAADDKFFVQLHKPGVVTHRDTNNPIYPQEWDETGETVYEWYGIAFLSGTVADNLTFYPMIRPQGTDTDYVEGMYPNSVLSEDTGWLTLQSGIQYRKKGGIVYVHVEFPQADIPSGGASGWVGLNIGNQLPVGFRPSIVIRNAMGFRALADNQHKITMGQINTVGGIQYNAHNIGVVDNTLFNSIVADFCYPV